jgi:DNA-directed RNA polymerase subunit RPC12/RpoP
MSVTVETSRMCDECETELQLADGGRYRVCRYCGTTEPVLR